MPTYVMQSCVLSRGIYDEVDKMCRTFIWGDEENHRKVHLLSWEKLCKPKKEGGLGMRPTRDANTAFVMKGLWNFCPNPDSLWWSIMRSKYKCGWRGIPKIETKRKGSNYWNGLGAIWEDFRKLLIWDIGNGDNIRFWTKPWLSDNEVLTNYCIVSTYKPFCVL